MIKFIKNPSVEPYNMAYHIGAVVSLDNEAELIESGIAVEVPKHEIEEVSNPAVNEQPELSATTDEVLEEPAKKEPAKKNK